MNEVNWIVVRDRTQELVPLFQEDPRVLAAFYVQMGRFGDLATTDRRAAQWAGNRTNAALLMAALAGGYGVGRLAVGTVADPVADSQGQQDAERAGAEIAAYLETARFEEVAKCSPDSLALAAAVEGYGAEDTLQRLADPVERLQILASRSGFLIAIFEEALFRDGKSQPI